MKAINEMSNETIKNAKRLQETINLILLTNKMVEIITNHKFIVFYHFISCQNQRANF
jgi:hypothetical protein